MKVNVVEQWRVAPTNINTNTNSCSSNSSDDEFLNLTFLDIPWLLFPSPAKPLFFFQTSLPLPHHHLHSLRHSLSLSLSLFPPLAGTLLLPPEPFPPLILCGGAVSFSLAHSDADDHLFHSLSSHHSQRHAADFHKLVPELITTTCTTDHTKRVPLMAVQATVFPNGGFCLGFAINHVAADARTFNNFIKVWSSLSRDLLSGFDFTKTLAQCSSYVDYDRTVIVDSGGLKKSSFLNEWWSRNSHVSSSCIVESPKEMTVNNNNNNIRATFVVGPTDMEGVKSWILTLQLHSGTRSEPQSLYLSPYVLTCALIWVTLVKAQHHVGIVSPSGHPNYFGFIAGGLTRIGSPVPVGYFGNCVGFGRAEASRGELLGELGIVAAARAIGGTIKRLDRAMLGGWEKWMRELEEIIGSEIHVIVSGSPKVEVYGRDRDFGWGRVKKIEEVEIDSVKGFSLSESRDVKGGMEVGLVLPKHQMDAFTMLFNQAIKTLSSYRLL